MSKSDRFKSISRFTIPAALVLLVGCGDSSTQADDLKARNTTVEQVLDQLGVGTETSSRVDDDGDPLPDTYSPLGNRRTVNRFAEILLFGGQLADSITTEGRMPALDINPGENNTFDWELLHDEPLTKTPWLDNDDDTPRAVINGDFDDDGQDEVAIVYQLDGDPLRLVVMQDAAEGFAVSAPQVISTETWNQVFLAAGDVDGNGTVDVVAGLVDQKAGATLLILNNGGETFAVSETSLTIERAGDGGGEIQLAMETGNLDYDNALELGVVINQYSGNITGAAQGDSSDSSRYFIYDDATTDFAVLKSGFASINTGSGTTTALVSDIALGDVDGDNVDEVVLGGLDRVDNARNGEPNYLVEVFDDAKREFAHLAGHSVSSDVGQLKPSASGATQYLLYLHVVTADIDGDGAAEIVTNQFVYEDLRQAPGSLTPYQDGDGVVQIPLKDLFSDGDSGDDYYFSWATSAMAAGDVTSDKRDNIVLHAQRLSVNGESQELQVWGVDQIDGWKEILDLETTVRNPLNSGGDRRPQILLADLEVDNESMALEYSDGSYRFIFTEPILLAVLAAPPCATDLGQDLGESCRAAFGQAVSESETRENGWSFIAGVSVGFDGTVPFVGGPEAILDTRNTLRHYTSSAYTVTKRVLRETGPIEDSVIFTTVPLDVYSYKILSHPNPELVGQNIEVRLPREPITVMVEREVYNAAVEEGALQIDDKIFQHTEGTPSSYPSAADKDRLLGEHDGLESDEVDVGQGSGQTVVSITEFTATTRGRSYEFEATLNLKATTGAIVGGFTIGGGADVALEITRGDENIYQGSVGHIAAEFFPQQSYSWGLFAYIYQDKATDQTFEVLDYWVD